MFINDIKSGKILYFLRLKKMLCEVNIFELTNWDLKYDFSNILGFIKVQFTQGFHDFKRIKILIKIINYLNLFDFDNNYLNWIE